VFPSFRRFGVPGPVFLMTFSMGHAAVARLVVFLLDTVNILHGPQFLWV
jgi:hypothetical protein